MRWKLSFDDLNHSDFAHIDSVRIPPHAPTDSTNYHPISLELQADLMKLIPQTTIQYFNIWFVLVSKLQSLDFMNFLIQNWGTSSSHFSTSAQTMGQWSEVILGLRSCLELGNISNQTLKPHVLKPKRALSPVKLTPIIDRPMIGRALQIFYLSNGVSMLWIIHF